MTTGSEMSLEVGDTKNSHCIKTELSYKKEDKLKKKKKKKLVIKVMPASKSLTIPNFLQ